MLRLRSTEAIKSFLKAHRYLTGVAILLASISFSLYPKHTLYSAWKSTSRFIYTQKNHCEIFIRGSSFFDQDQERSVIQKKPKSSQISIVLGAEIKSFRYPFSTFVIKF